MGYRLDSGLRNPRNEPWLDKSRGDDGSGIRYLSHAVERGLNNDDRGLTKGVKKRRKSSRRILNSM